MCTLSSRVESWTLHSYHPHRSPTNHICEHIKKKKLETYRVWTKISMIKKTPLSKCWWDKLDGALTWKRRSSEGCHKLGSSVWTEGPWRHAQNVIEWLINTAVEQCVEFFFFYLAPFLLKCDLQFCLYTGCFNNQQMIPQDSQMITLILMKSYKRHSTVRVCTSCNHLHRHPSSFVHTLTHSLCNKNVSVWKWIAVISWLLWKLKQAVWRKTMSS